MKPPTLAGAPVKGVSAVIANKVVAATVQLASFPVTSINGGGAPAGLMNGCCVRCA